MIRTILAAFIFSVVLISWSYSQTNPGFVQGQILGATQLNNAFAAKTDYPGQPINITNAPYSAKCDGVTDDTSSILAAIASLPVGGGTILFPSTLCLISQTISINKNGVKLIGLGAARGFHQTITPQTAGLTWAGAVGGIMVSIAITPGAATRLDGAQIVDMALYGNGIAATCLITENIQSSRFDGVYIENCTTAGVDLTVVNPPPVESGPSNCRNLFSQLHIRQSAIAAGIALRFTGDAAAAGNSCLNTFIGTSIIHNNGHGIYVNFGDHNWFYGTEILHTTGGTGDSLVFDSLSASFYAQGNQFYGLSVQGFDAFGGRVHAMGFSKGNLIAWGDAYNGGGVDAAVVIDSSALLIVQVENEAFYQRSIPYRVSGWFVADEVADNQLAGAAITQDTITCHPGMIKRAITISDLGALVTTAVAGNVQFALYKNAIITSNVSVPGALIASTGSISTNVVAPAAASGTLTGGSFKAGYSSSVGDRLWFCMNNDNSTAAYQSIGALGIKPATTPGAGAITAILGGNTFRYFKCTGANCQGGISTFGTWPADLSTSNWGAGFGSDNKMGIIVFKVANDCSAGGC